MNTTPEPLSPSVLRARIDEALPWARIEVRARSATPLRLEAYAGSLLRSAVGRRLLDGLCAERHRATCEGCPLVASCGFPPLMEPRALPPAEDGHPGVPPPGLVLMPPLDGSDRLAAGAPFEFSITAIGRRASAGTLTALQRAVWALEDEVGLGDDRGRLHIEEITVSRSPASSRITEGVASPLAVTLLTPLSVKREKRIQRQVTSNMLIWAIRHRLDVLAKAHGVVPLALPDIGQFDPPPTLHDDETRWVSFPRYSRRQAKWMRLEGLVGRFALRGPLGLAAPLLEAAVALHVGRKPLFGFGRLRLDGLE